MSEGYLEKLQDLVAERSTDYRQMGQLVSLANLAQYRLEREIVGLNHELTIVKKKLETATYILSDVERVSEKMKCVDFPAELYLRVCEFIGKDFEE